MTSERECFVYVVLPGATEFVTAGRFRWSDPGTGGVGQFVYGRSYRERGDAVELDPVELRLSGRVYETARIQGFFGAIRDAMPDYWGRCVIDRNAGSGGLSEFDYLLQGPDDRAGALGFGLDVAPPLARRRFNRTLDLAGLQRAADAIVAGDSGPAGSVGVRAEELLLLATSMGGARPKAVVEDGRALWIAKFGRSDDRWNHPRVEHGMLSLARACGLSVPGSRVETVGGRDVLLVRRFDRDRWDGGYRRHRMVSALTLLRTGDSVSDRGDWSYLLFADEVRRASAGAQDDLRELFGRICFNAAVSNLDDHPRNHAIAAAGPHWRLSPAFDLTPAPVVALDRRDLAMACGRFGRYANRTNLLSGAGRFLLGREEAEAIFGRIANTVRDRWDAEMRRAGASGRDCREIASAFLYDGLFYENVD
ncbi:MAG: HipA domain-containing protein [Gammaproteobacteria bacterium]|nr:HipA domain-containing protein [Gammaproteobacteria bacterium]MDE0249197.1 HipA domain-containing protein [Gammaproteobacteria bacterium]